MLYNINRFLFYCSLLFLIVFLWTVTIGPVINIEFKDYKLSGAFYNIVYAGAPVALLLTLLGTYKKHHSKKRKGLTVGATIGATILLLLFILNTFFTTGFGVWTTNAIAYQNNKHPHWQIREQQYDIGAFGYGGNRVVTVKPFAFLFWKVDHTDTNKIDKKAWTRVAQTADVLLP